MSDEMFIRLGIKGVDSAAAGFKRLADVGGSSAKRLVLSWAGAGRAMNDTASLMKKTFLMAGGTAVLRAAIMDVVEFERALTEMRLTGNLTAQETENIKKQMLSLSETTLQLPEDQLRAFKDMVAAGIDPKVAIKGLESINKTATATFADVGDIGASAVDLFQKMDLDPGKWEKAFGIMLKAGKAGRFELKDMARFFPTITSEMARYGIVSEKGLSQTAAMLQIARRGTGSPEQAVTNMQNFFSHITQYRKQFKAAGINIYDFIDTKTGRFKAGKDIDALMEDIIKKTGGSIAKLERAGIRDIQTKQFLNVMMMYWEDYKKIRDDSVVGDNVVNQDFAKVAETKYAELQKLKTAQSKAMKSEASANLASKTLGLGNWAIENPGKAIAAAIGGYALFKGGSRIAKDWINKKWGGVEGGLGLPGLGGAGGPVPVYVVNRHLSMLPGQGWGFPGGANADVPGRLPGGKLRLSAATIDLAQNASLLGMVGVASFQITSALLNVTGLDKKLFEAGEKQSPWLYAITPLFALSERLLQKKYDNMAQGNAPQVNVNVQVDKDGRAFVDTNSKDARIKTTTPLGEFFSDMGGS